MPEPSEALGPISLATMAFSTFMPNMSDIRQAIPDSDIGDESRNGSVIAAAVTAGAGAVASAISERQWPLWVSVVAAVGFILLYETVLESPPTQTRENRQSGDRRSL